MPSDDLAMLPAGGATVVDALANDTDPPVSYTHLTLPTSDLV